jgi:hypothetical protein
MFAGSAAVTRERLERAIVALAYIVVKHGPRYAPLLERCEREYRERFSDPVAHAQAILDSYRGAASTRGKAPALMGHDA